MNRKFCYLCSARLEQKTNASWWCPACKYTQYENARPCAELVLYKDGKILITERGIEPQKGTFDMPGGFAELEETLEAALLREAKEELDLDAPDITDLIYLWSFNHTYPFGPEVYRTLVSVFFAELTSDKQLSAHDDVASLRWITPQEAEEVKWASPLHRENIKQALRYLSKK